MPFNVQNAVGNWLQLVGQAIETYNAQQQYFQGGPGRFFSPKYYNATNPFCSTTSTSSTQNSSSRADNKNSNNNNEKSSTSGSNTTSSCEKDADKIQALELRINELTAEIEQIKKELKR
jgi:anti-sigma28 factor (negative regulator of flagellin synthesis)